MDIQDLGPAKTFFAFMEAVLASDLTASQRMILLVQAKHADAHDGSLTGSFPNEKTLARETGLSVDTIQRARKVLAEKGWLVQTHCGRGGSSKLSNAFDLDIPQGAALQSRMVRKSKPHGAEPKPQDAVTSTPSSTPRSAPASTPQDRAVKEDVGRNGEPGDTYWVGTSRNKPEGYFIRALGRTQPKGNHVLVTLTGPEVQDVFQPGLAYEERRDRMMEHARLAGLRPAPGPRMVAGETIKADARSPRRVRSAEVPDRQPVAVPRSLTAPSTLEERLAAFRATR